MGFLLTGRLAPGGPELGSGPSREPGIPWEPRAWLATSPDASHGAFLCF